LTTDGYRIRRRCCTSRWNSPTPAVLPTSSGRTDCRVAASPKNRRRKVPNACALLKVACSTTGTHGWFRLARTKEDFEEGATLPTDDRHDSAVDNSAGHSRVASIVAHIHSWDYKGDPSRVLTATRYVHASGDQPTPHLTILNICQSRSTGTACQVAFN
jgi:hypothetical protein